MYLIFDTETTGMPKKWKAPVTDTFNWPRMVQIAWQVHDKDHKLIESHDYIIQPEGFEIPEDSTNVHGISTAIATEKGIDLAEVLEKFKLAIRKADYIIAHNINFDEKVVGCEFVRKNINHQLFVSERICTMQEGTYHCKLKGTYGRFKWPTLHQLHFKLFQEKFDNAHNAQADVKATARCFFKMLDEEIIDWI